MKPLMFLLVPAALFTQLGFGGPSRFARLGEFEGKVEAQLQAADPWIEAQRNLALPESAWVRTGAGSRVEIEFDEASVWRLGPDSLAEISDYSRLSTGQRITLISLDHGLAYFTGECAANDALSLAVPGAQVILHRGARVRLEAQDGWSQIAVIEGAVRFSSPAAEVDLREGQTVKVEPANPARFFLYREVTHMDLDRWSDARDHALAGPSSARHVPERYGLADLDASGQWIQTEDLGAVWKPKTAEDWTPYRQGRWLWCDTLGYTWVSDDSWGWLPYHYGRWLHRDGIGWVWAPAKSETFKPAEVYWLAGAKFAGWGPLAPGEAWTPAAQPVQFLNANTTWAAFRQDLRVIDPAGFKDRPKEPLGVAAFALALPSPAFAAERLDAARPVLRAGSTRITPFLTGVTYQESQIPRVVAATAGAQPATLSPVAPDPQPVALVTNAGAVQSPVVILSQPALQPVPDSVAAPAEVFYPAPVYTSIIVVNPPERQPAPPRRKPDPAPQQPAQPSKVPPTTSRPPLAQGSPNPPASPGAPPVRREPPPDAPPIQKPRPFDEAKHDTSGHQQ
jgi:hypothetical protein